MPDRVNWTFEQRLDAEGKPDLVAYAVDLREWYERIPEDQVESFGPAWHGAMLDLGLTEEQIREVRRIAAS